jgi:hypothetical protein
MRYRIFARHRSGKTFSKIVTGCILALIVREALIKAGGWLMIAIEPAE